MKQALFLCLVLAAGTRVMAQDTKATVQKTATSSKTVATEGVFSAFESTLSDGPVTFTKRMTRNAEGAFTTVYYLQARNSSFNSGKPFPITLSRESFDTYFQKSTQDAAQRYTQLLKFAQERRLSYNDEASWIRLLNYYNTL